MDRPPDRDDLDARGRTPAWSWAVVVLSGVMGLALMWESAGVGSATYDEVAYLRIAADWWRTGRTEEMTRMGSPVTFFKLQAGPAFWALDRLGLGGWIDDPLGNQARLLPIVRRGSLWIWAVAFGLTAAWSLTLHGHRAMAFAAILFAMSPNLLAHGALATMEIPVVAATTAMAWLFWRFLDRGRRSDFVLSAAVGGLAFSCKFTTVLIPPILGVLWLVDLRRSRCRSPILMEAEQKGRMADGKWQMRSDSAICHLPSGPSSPSNLIRDIANVTTGMTGYILVLLAANLAVTGLATLPLSVRSGDHPSVPGILSRVVEWRWPQDWAGFATQVLHQRHGGPSYLLGERRTTGWWYYYPIALAVKTPLACLMLIGARCLMAARSLSTRRDWFPPALIVLFLLAAMLGSKRNYGVRYLLPLAPMAVVWVSALAERRGSWRWVAGLGLIGQGVALASIHPHELSYFNEAAGGPIGGRRVLADSNLDWGQGLRSLARLERDRFGPMTVYYFGDTDPASYGVRSPAFVFTANAGPPGLPSRFAPETRYVAVSASLQHGPWGPEGYFRDLDGRAPVAYTDDATIAIYDLGQAAGPRP